MQSKPGEARKLPLQHAKQPVKPQEPVMLSVTYRANKMLQSLVLAFIAEIIILLLLWSGFAGLQKLNQKEMTASSIIQLNSSPEEKKPLDAQQTQKTMQKPKNQVKQNPIIQKAVMHNPAPEKLAHQTAFTEPVHTQMLSGDPTGIQNGFAEQVTTQGGKNGKENPLTLYAAQVKAAVQAAVEYPEAANNLRVKSRARVEFSLRDGQQKNPHILISSGLGVFDRAAIRVVEMAHYPAPPPVLAGQEKLFQVWVEFHR